MMQAAAGSRENGTKRAHVRSAEDNARGWNSIQINSTMRQLKARDGAVSRELA